jgi:hypothetical protein
MTGLHWCYCDVCYLSNCCAFMLCIIIRRLSVSVCLYLVVRLEKKACMMLLFHLLANLYADLNQLFPDGIVSCSCQAGYVQQSSNTH